jgi:subtilase family serine protease
MPTAIDTDPCPEPLRGRRSRRRVVVAGVLAGVAVAGGGVALSTQSGGGSSGGPTTGGSRSGGYSPQTLWRAYGVSPLLREGIDGRGETVVLPDAIISNPSATSNIRQDLTAFDRRFHLPRVDLAVSRALGYTGTTSLALPEEVLDAEMVHAIAPAAKITVMLSGPHAYSPPNLAPLLRAAAERGNIISASLDDCQPCLSAGQLRWLNSALSDACERHISVIAAAGDGGRRRAPR